ncbi:MAG: STAS-like domain-containing protein [Candidatus Micrarchaeia archaeon]|jgi:translation elongation factor EF-G
MTTETIVRIFDQTGEFAEDKNKAKEMRAKEILPALERNETVILNFEKVNSTTQSFIHALISEAIKQKGIDILDRLLFKNCNQIVQEVVKIVVEYLQDPPKLSDLPTNDDENGHKASSFGKRI